MQIRKSRRKFLQTTGLALGGLSLGGISPLVQAAPQRANDQKDRILVIVELSGGNDGLNSIVPHGDDAYYRARPNIGIAKEKLLALDDHFGFNPGMVGLQRLWQEGQLA
ncbi:MAG: twin-arginine translocation signal domain-containing protein, partial [Proteobacteria bacterium]|nr:twin-arginine translocation signal domain-containing protein [Pseudomonadota bacterium]